MAYVIQYGPVAKQRIRKRGKGVWVVLAACVVCMGLIPGVRSWIWDLIVPGDPKVTTQAFSEFVKDIQAGETVTAAIEDFCTRILAYV